MILKGGKIKCYKKSTNGLMMMIIQDLTKTVFAFYYKRPRHQNGYLHGNYNFILNENLQYFKILKIGRNEQNYQIL